MIVHTEFHTPKTTDRYTLKLFNLMVVGGVMLPLVDIDVSGVVGQTVWGVDGHPDCGYGWY